jgi:hypothetical protein
VWAAKEKEVGWRGRKLGLRDKKETSRRWRGKGEMAGQGERGSPGIRVRFYFSFNKPFENKFNSVLNTEE